jgi:hypothetical protein
MIKNLEVLSQFESFSKTLLAVSQNQDLANEELSQGVDKLVDSLGLLENLNTTDKSTIVSAVSEVKTQVVNLEQTVATNTAFRGSIDDLSELDNLSEADLRAGYMWRHSKTSDIYIYGIDLDTYDYKPNNWNGGFTVFFNALDLTNAVNDIENKIGKLSELKTDTKVDIVSALNELRDNMMITITHKSQIKSDNKLVLDIKPEKIVSDFVTIYDNEDLSGGYEMRKVSIDTDDDTGKTLKISGDDVSDKYGTLIITVKQY